MHLRTFLREWEKQKHVYWQLKRLSVEIPDFVFVSEDIWVPMQLVSSCNRVKFLHHIPIFFQTKLRFSSWIVCLSNNNNKKHTSTKSRKKLRMYLWSQTYSRHTLKKKSNRLFLSDSVKLSDSLKFYGKIIVYLFLSKFRILAIICRNSKLLA